MRDREDDLNEPNGPCAASLAGVRVLVVDDDARVRLVLTALLEADGASVTGVGSAAQALRVLPVERPDVLLTDLNMPEVDGLGLIRQVRALPPEHGGRTPAVLITGVSDALDRAKVLRAGFQFCLGKPVDARELVASVAILATKE